MTMRVKVVKENRIMPIGSVCEVLDESGTEYAVMFCSMMGSYQYDIPKAVCEILPDEEQELVPA